MTVANGVFSVATADRDAPPWSGAIHLLEAILADHTGLQMPATVLLSNHFVRYVVVPWSDSLREEAEVISFARHCFTKMYGETVGQWELRISPDRAGAARLASAVDPGLLSALRGVLAKAEVRLYSVQPHLMAIYNEHRHAMKGRNAWFVLVEPGSLCLALLQQGHWTRVRCMRIGEAWRAELPLILDREAYVADTKMATDQVYLWTAEGGAVSLPDHSRWQIHMLAPDPKLDATAETADRLAMAMER